MVRLLADLVVRFASDEWFRRLYNLRHAGDPSTHIWRLLGDDSGGDRCCRYYYLVQRGGYSLLSPTSKFIGFGMDYFRWKFERYCCVEEGDTVLDVGACIGDTAVAMGLKAGENGSIIAVEPDPVNLKYLCLNLEQHNFKNKVIIVGKAAASSRGGGGRVFLNRHASPTGQSLQPLESRRGSVEVETDTLDSIVNGREVDFVKIDVQGAEADVLRGAPNLLRNVKKLIVETHGFGEHSTASEAMRLIRQSCTRYHHNIIWDAETRTINVVTKKQGKRNVELEMGIGIAGVAVG